MVGKSNNHFPVPRNFVTLFERILTRVKSPGDTEEGTSARSQGEAGREIGNDEVKVTGHQSSVSHQSSIMTASRRTDGVVNGSQVCEYWRAIRPPRRRET